MRNLAFALVGITKNKRVYFFRGESITSLQIGMRKMPRIVEKIPSMDDNQILHLFNNAMRLSEKPEKANEAEVVLLAIQNEWLKRLLRYQQHQYKAATPEVGMLKTLGYHVGNDGDKSAKRRKILDFIMTGVLPPVSSPAYVAEWGEPRTSKRYRKLHRTIQALKSGADHFDNREKAAIEWAEDLEYIEATWSARAVS
jgi:hypothetical protein